MSSGGASRAASGMSTHHASFIHGHTASMMHGGKWHGHGWQGRGGGYPYLGYGYGYGFGGGFLSSLLYGLGGYGYGGYGTAYGNGYYDPAWDASLPPGTTDLSAGALASALPGMNDIANGGSAATASVFADRGEAAFRAGDYKGAVYAWRHAVIDDPQNPLVLMLLGQALFATGHFDEAAGATQGAMQMLPKEHWGVVVKNFRELYGNPLDYTTHLRALEKAEGEKPNDPAMRFLAGFHYAYLGYPNESIDQLDKGLKIVPRDEMAKQLRDEMQAKLPGAVTTPAAPATPTSP
jgi:tetratricopeptide (TPR) repeat protein